MRKTLSHLLAFNCTYARLSVQRHVLGAKAYILLLFFALLWTACPEKHIASSHTDHLEQLLAKMSLEEKVGQTAQFTLDVITRGNNIYSSFVPVELDQEMLQLVIGHKKAGSILNTAAGMPLSPEKWSNLIDQIQEYALQTSGIPILYGVDAIHGATYTLGSTFFPQQIGQAATFNRALVKKAAQVTAYETRASNIPWNFSPVLDLGRHSAWPRLWETYGEDAFLCSQMGIAAVQGYQGDNRNRLSEDHVAACLKHFLGYGEPRWGKDRTPANIPVHQLREKHYEPFVRAIEAGALSVMVNSGIVNGESVHASKTFITEWLKNDLAFDGVVVTDWNDIYNLHRRDKIASTEKEAIKLAFNAGIDIAMIPYDVKYTDYLTELVRDGEVSMERLNDAVRRVLRLKFRLGLFDRRPHRPLDYVAFNSAKFQKMAQETAAESIVLLKNKKQLLPLSTRTKVLVTGPNAHSMRTINGGWTLSWQGQGADEHERNGATFLEAIRQKIDSSLVVYAPGLQYDSPNDPAASIAHAVKEAENVDVIVAFVGENSYTEMPGNINDLDLDHPQQRLIVELAKTQKPIVLVLNEGRPRIISDIEPLCQAVFQTFLPGSYGGLAFADILFGEVNPSGKMPYTYPKYTNSLACYDFKPSENQEQMQGAYNYESVQAVQYAFGYGLSYTQFAYTKLTLDKEKYAPTDTILVQVAVENRGNYSGKEAVLLFASDDYASISPDNRRLIAFEKIELQAGDKTTLTFRIRPAELAFVNLNQQWVVEKGSFTLQAGEQVAKFELTEDRSWKNPFRH